MMSLGKSLFNARKRGGYHAHGITRNSNNLNLKERAIWQLKQKLKFQMILNFVKY